LAKFGFLSTSVQLNTARRFAVDFDQDRGLLMVVDGRGAKALRVDRVFAAHGAEQQWKGEREFAFLGWLPPQRIKAVAMVRDTRNERRIVERVFARAPHDPLVRQFVREVGQGVLPVEVPAIARPSLPLTSDAQGGYRDATGARFVLTADPEQRHAIRVVRASVYRALGFDAPHLSVVHRRGKRYLAARALDAGSATELDFSDGQLRLLGFAAALLGDESWFATDRPGWRYAEGGVAVGQIDLTPLAPPATETRMFWPRFVARLPAAHPWRDGSCARDLLVVLEMPVVGDGRQHQLAVGLGVAPEEGGPERRDRALRAIRELVASEDLGRRIRPEIFARPHRVVLKQLPQHVVERLPRLWHQFPTAQRLGGATASGQRAQRLQVPVP
jgi:hypothetical protein